MSNHSSGEIACFTCLFTKDTSMNLSAEIKPSAPTGLLSALAVTLIGTSLLSANVLAASLDEIKERGEIRIAVANEIPYGFIDPNGEAKGAGPDVAQHLVEELGFDEIEWVTTNIGSLIPGLQADRFDMVAEEVDILQQRCERVFYS